MEYLNTIEPITMEQFYDTAEDADYLISSSRW